MMQILVVEDSESDRYLLERSLEDTFGTDCKVEVVSRVKDALRKLRRRDYNFCICDHRLTDGTSIDLLTHLERANIRVPVVVLSGVQENNFQEELCEAGALGFVSKVETNSQYWASKVARYLNPDRAIPLPHQVM